MQHYTVGTFKPAQALLESPMRGASESRKIPWCRQICLYSSGRSEIAHRGGPLVNQLAGTRMLRSIPLLLALLVLMTSGCGRDLPDDGKFENRAVWGPNLPPPGLHGQ